MGVIKFTPCKELPVASTAVSGSFKKLYVANWRLLREVIGEEKLIITNHNFQMFKIYDITLQEFHDNNKTGGSITKPFEYLRNSLSCGICDGYGCIDWIQKVMGRDVKTIPYLTKLYRRDPNNITLLKPLPIHRHEKLYGSIPKLPFGFEVCSKCKGCGVDSVVHVDYMTRI